MANPFKIGDEVVDRDSGEAAYVVAVRGEAVRVNWGPRGDDPGGAFWPASEFDPFDEVSGDDELSRLRRDNAQLTASITALQEAATRDVYARRARAEMVDVLAEVFDTFRFKGEHEELGERIVAVLAKAKGES